MRSVDWFGSAGAPIRRFVWLALLMVGACASDAARSPGLTSPSPSPPECRPTPRALVSSNPPREHPVGGRLAASVPTTTPAVNTYDKTLWSLRGAAPQTVLFLVATRDPTGEQHIHFVATRYTIDNESGLLDWGPTYFTRLGFPATGCWKVSVLGGDRDDFIVFWVTAPPT